MTRWSVLSSFVRWLAAALTLALLVPVAVSAAPTRVTTPNLSPFSPVCTPAGDGLCTVTLSPAQTLTVVKQRHDAGTWCEPRSNGLYDNTAETLPPGQVAVGYTHQHYDSGDIIFACTTTDDAFYRGAIRFDLGRIANSRLLSARLSYRAASSTVGGGGLPPQTRTGCATATQLGLATQDWTGWQPGSHDALDADPGYDLPVQNCSLQQQTGALTVDVSSQVRRWLVGDPNLGFVFIGALETLPDDNWTANSHLTDIQLQLTYFV